MWCMADVQKANEGNAQKWKASVAPWISTFGEESQVEGLVDWAPRMRSTEERMGLEKREDVPG